MNDALLKFQIGDMIMVEKERPNLRYYGIIGEGEVIVLLREEDTTPFDGPSSRSLKLATHVDHLSCQKGDVISLIDDGTDKACFFLDLWTFIDGDKRDAIRSALSFALSVHAGTSFTTITVKYNKHNE